MQQTSALISLRYVTRIAAIIILVVVAVGFFLPADYQIERSIVVDRTNVASVKARLFQANSWPHWMHIEQGQLRLESFSDSVLEGADFVISYDSDVAKSGRIEVSHVSDTSIDFIVTPNQKTLPIPNQIRLTELKDGQLKVDWIIAGELDAGFLSPYLAMLANVIAGSNIETSLSNLDQ